MSCGTLATRAPGRPATGGRSAGGDLRRSSGNGLHAPPQTGAAGTGKTTVVCAIILAVRATEGEGAPITVMAPTGKASDRLRTKLLQRDIERVETSTVHSYLAKEGWLNENLTYRQRGGGRHGQGTIIVDEASMLDLSLMATFVRAIDWRAVRRLVLVGDPNQLPPIGRGRVFADTIEWLSNKPSPSVVRLEHNLRQLENEVARNGTAILRLANLFIAQSASTDGQATTPEAEELLTQVHSSGHRLVLKEITKPAPIRIGVVLSCGFVSDGTESHCSPDNPPSFVTREESHRLLPQASARNTSPNP